jgi:hypothetical protein
MQFLGKRSLSKELTFLFLCGLSLPFGEVVLAAQNTVQWSDKTENEAGFKIERKQGTSGTYSQIVTVEANTTSYVDADLSPSTTYCYRVRAYTSSGNSPYSNDVCVTTPAQKYRLSVSLVGSGNLTSSSSGVNCPTDCAQDYVARTKVRLTPKPLTGWRFSSWGGKCVGQSSTCMVTMSDIQNVTVNFSR